MLAVLARSDYVDDDGPDVAENGQDDPIVSLRSLIRIVSERFLVEILS